MQSLLRIFIFLVGLTFYAQCVTPENPTLTVTTMIEKPYTMLRANHETLTGNEKYEGYMVDLIDEIAKTLDFKYELQLVPDSSYGHLDKGKWNGVMGEVMDGRATIAAAPLTITSDREAAVDFTIPFMTLGISILYKRPSGGVELPFKNVEDLAESKTTNFGCTFKGSTCRFFADSDNPTYKRIYERMTETSSFVNNIAKGIERVKSEDYAFLMESTTLEYAVEHDCELQQVGGLLNTKGFGLAVQQGSPLREKLSQAILRLQETGVLAVLKDKWWKMDAGKCAQ